MYEEEEYNEPINPVVEMATKWMRMNGRKTVPKFELEAMLDEAGLDVEDSILDAIDKHLIEDYRYRGACYRLVP